MGTWVGYVLWIWRGMGLDMPLLDTKSPHVVGFWSPNS